VNPSSSILGLSSSLPAVGRENLSRWDAVLFRDPRRNHQTGAIIGKIEDILVANVDALTENRVMTIPVRSRRTGRMQLVRFPSPRDTEAKKFSRLINLLV
jgi:hypothetical protein